MFYPSKLSLAITLILAGAAAPTSAAEGGSSGEVMVLDTLTVTATQGATKTETPFIETPQAISVIDSEEWEEQGAISVQRAANYTPGVSTNQVGASNRYDYLIIRGFSDGSINNTYLDGLKLLGDSGGYNSLTIDPWFLERIEIVKGPSSVLYGQNMPGGLVALTSKRPEFEHERTIRLGVGNHDYRSVAFDFTGPLDEEGRLAYRLTGLARATDTQFDHVEEERYTIAPSMTWKMTDHTDLTLLAYLQKDPEGGYHAGLPYEGTVTNRNGRKISNNFFEGEPDYDKFEREMALLGYDFEHRFNDSWSARQKFRYLKSDVEMDQVYAAGRASDTELTRYYSGGDENLEAFTVDNQLQANLATGSLNHTLLLGLDFQKRDNQVSWPSGAFPAINAFNPVYGSEPLGPFYPWNEKHELKQTGVYLQDQIVMNQWHLTLGGRYDWVDIENSNPDTDAASELDDTQFSGRAGLLYLFDSGLAPYISYSTSFMPNTVADANGNLVDPTEGEQVELGLKYQPVGTQDQYTLALFQISQENLATKLPNEEFFRPVGEIESQGVELEAKTRLTDNLRLQAGYSYTEATFEQAEEYREGNNASQIPRHQLNLWTHYAFYTGLLAGLDAGIGVRYNADIYADDANTEKVPNYALVDATIGYDFSKLGAEGVSARLNVTNLADKEYVASCYNSVNYCYFGAERSIIASVDYQF